MSATLTLLFVESISRNRFALIGVLIAVAAVLLFAILIVRRRAVDGSAAARPEATAIDSLLALAGEMLCLHDKEGCILQISGAIEDIAGVPADTIIGLRLDDFVHLDDRLSVLALWTRLSVGEAPPLLEFRFVHPSGRVIWVEARFSAIASDIGGAKFGSAIRDITRQHLAENELRGVRDDLSSGIAAGQGTLYRLVRQSNGKWKPIFFAANIERITGYSVAEAMRFGWPDDLLSLPNRASRWAALNEAIESGNGTAEYDLPSPAGTPIRVRDHFRRWDRSDATIEIVGYMVDITEAYGTDLRLRQAQEEIAAIASVGPGLLYRTVLRSPEDQRIVFVSQNVKELTGLTAEEITAPGWLTANIKGDLKAAQWKNVRRAIHWGTSSAEYHYQNRQGEWVWSRDTVRHVHGHNRQHELVGYVVDITEEKERAIQLAQAGKLATLGEMATGMAHELSQPLASISMAAENAMLALQAAPGNVALVTQKLERISQQAIRAAKLIDHMRIFGRRDGGHTQPVDLAVALDGALLILDARIRKTKIEIVRDIEPGLPNVLGSLVLIEQVMINLIANACDAFKAAKMPIPENRRRIEITAFTKGAMVVFVVADHAGGIQAGDLSKVFQPFFTTKAAGEGTGLGLSISYGIVSDMSGTMTAYNSEDGAVFELRLPVHSENAADVVMEQTPQKTDA